MQLVTQIPNVREFKRSQGRGWGVQCKQIKRDGCRCGRWAIRGGFVCFKHGGQLPVVRASANARLRAMAPLAVQVIERAMTEGKPAERFRAARYVLRYSGIAPANVRTTQSRGERAALGQGAPTPSPDDEIEALLSGLMDETRRLASGDTTTSSGTTSV